ncbi:hypothetical protein PNEG_00148 [Pneumocystis murina B123]|uniref:Nuclear protein localization protein 4 n=1 Tax=Pneumocystis murina (strain B123) TaxID=1069680 RepID=M7PMM1_PNEMU|nr:hypothetical protein PNEG_00148 [Pneumocystis murina B123]EMR11714.1 hypothetical protein PNEG_00148 [Pneumocystis murina B123]
MILRIRSKDGMQRISVDEQADMKIVEICGEKDLEKIEISKDPYKKRCFSSLSNGKTVKSLGFEHGDIVYIHIKEKEENFCSLEEKMGEEMYSLSYDACKQVIQDAVDDFLDTQDGKLVNTRSALCKHGSKGMCNNCVPLDPYDANYLKQNKIKHQSFHSYLKKIYKNNKNSIPGALLVEPFYGIKKDCQVGHKPWPHGICTKCQPSAVTLQPQEFRMVDHVEFSDSSIIDTFLNYWRLSGHQRFGFLYGRYKPYDSVPLGIKAVVEAIYEPPQENETNGISLDLPWNDENTVDEIAHFFGLKKIGMIFTDLTDDGSGKGTVICKRHMNSFFLSSLEIVFASKMQLKHKNICKWSKTGEFSSKFVTCVVSANKDGDIDIFAYQVSNSAMAMVDANIIEPSIDPNIMLIRKEEPDVYIPEVFFQKINQYGIQVQENAKSAFPVEYLLITLTHGFPMNPDPIFPPTFNTFIIENRTSIGQVQNIYALAEKIKPIIEHPDGDILKTFCDFHFLTYLWTLGILNKDDGSLFIKCIRENNITNIYSLLDTPSWQTLITILHESNLL